MGKEGGEVEMEGEGSMRVGSWEVVPWLEWLAAVAATRSRSSQRVRSGIPHSDEIRGRRRCYLPGSG